MVAIVRTPRESEWPVYVRYARRMARHGPEAPYTRLVAGRLRYTPEPGTSRYVIVHLSTRPAPDTVLVAALGRHRRDEAPHAAGHLLVVRLGVAPMGPSCCACDPRSGHPDEA